MSDRKEFRDLVPPAEAREAIATLDLRPEPETVPLAEARGRVLAERVDAGLDVPGFDRASMDGYAVRARDTFGADEMDPATLALVGEVHAGSAPDVEVGAGEAVEISTGAVLPPGADAVVMVERCDLVEPRSSERAVGEAGRETDGDVKVRTSVAPGDHVMLAGADIAAGERALGSGTRLTPREIGLLSALGVESVPVRGEPRVGIVSTGDELVRPGDSLDSAAGQIYDVNSNTIAAAVEEAGGDPVLYPHAGDDYDEMERLLARAAAECDLVLSSGSTSASAVDVIYRVIEDRGELLVHGVAVKPGKPMLVGRMDESAYIGLPGYPVSALTIFSAFVAPSLREASGRPEPEAATVEAAMATEERYEGGRQRLLPVGLVEAGAERSSASSRTGDARETTVSPSRSSRAETLAYPVDKGSGATTSLVEADGIVEVGADVNYLDAGEPVTVRLFSADVHPPAVFGVGEDDPVFSRLLDDLPRPRYLSVGSREGERRLRDGVPDFAVTTAPEEARRDVDAVELGEYVREWGLVVPTDNPADVSGTDELLDRDLRFVNRGADSGTRMHFDRALADVAAERGMTRHDASEEIAGYSLTANAHESPARTVAAGDADVGLGLRATATKLDLGFVAMGDERVSVLGNPDRERKEGVRALTSALASELGEILQETPGYRSTARRTR